MSATRRETRVEAATDKLDAHKSNLVTTVEVARKEQERELKFCNRKSTLRSEKFQRFCAQNISYINLQPCTGTTRTTSNRSLVLCKIQQPQCPPLSLPIVSRLSHEVNNSPQHIRLKYQRCTNSTNRAPYLNKMPSPPNLATRSSTGALYQAFST